MGHVIVFTAFDEVTKAAKKAAATAGALELDTDAKFHDAWRKWSDGATRRRDAKVRAHACRTSLLLLFLRFVFCPSSSCALARAGRFLL